MNSTPKKLTGFKRITLPFGLRIVWREIALYGSLRSKHRNKACVHLGLKTELLGQWSHERAMEAANTTVDNQRLIPLGKLWASGYYYVDARGNGGSVAFIPQLPFVTGGGLLPRRLKKAFKSHWKSAGILTWKLRAHGNQPAASAPRVKVGSRKTC